MIRNIKKILLSSLSILGISFLMWLVFLINPYLSYANQTQVDNVFIYHNEELEEGTEAIIRNALSMIENANIYDQDLKIQLCLNDDEIYPKLNPFAAATAYAFLNKTVIYASKPNFKHNYAAFTWEVNDHELRKYNLTALLAHEFMHNLQHNFNASYYIKSTLGRMNWKLEGHAEYIARGFKGDDRLKEKIEFYLIEETKDHLGIPVFKLEDGSIQNLSYFKYALVIQYLIEVKYLDFNEICELEMGLDDLYQEVMDWNKK